MDWSYYHFGYDDGEAGLPIFAMRDVDRWHQHQIYSYIQGYEDGAEGRLLSLLDPPA